MKSGAGIAFISAQETVVIEIRGTGLGLAIAKELIEAQGGTISISSVVDKGTTVTIHLRAVTDHTMLV